jgi:Polyketide cyclase / dehydrase and lipid transport
MTQEVHASTIIDVPLSEAWEKLRDISQAHNYVPGIVKTKIVSEQREGVGASRYVYRNDKSYIQETVEEWQAGSGFLIHLHKGDKPAPPFKDAWFRYALEDCGDGQTRLTTSLMYDMPWGRFGEWLGARIAGFVQATISDVVLSMKLYYETGEPTSAAALKVYKHGLK